IARSAGASQISFLAVDVANPHAFARRDAAHPDVALHPEELPELASIIENAIRTHAREFQTGFIAETPRKLLRILEYFKAVCGLGDYPPVRCNAPEFSAVVDAREQVHPCFFISGPSVAAPRGGTLPAAGFAAEESFGQDPRGSLASALNGPAMRALRAAIRAGHRPECAKCVCSMWRDLDAVTPESFLGSRPRRRPVA